MGFLRPYLLRFRFANSESFYEEFAGGFRGDGISGCGGVQYQSSSAIRRF
jgi:hypothetical protein